MITLPIIGKLLSRLVVTFLNSFLMLFGLSLMYFIRIDVLSLRMNWSAMTVHG